MRKITIQGATITIIKKESFIVVIILSIAVLICCNDGVSCPEKNCSNKICYVKFVNNNWEIYTNNISGSNAQNISNDSNDDEYPQWSPNGRYIVFRHSISMYGPLIYIYDLENKTYTNLTSDGGLADSQPKWAPNSKVYFAYQKPIGSTAAIYLMNPDGSDKRKILNFSSTQIFFYPDSYNFLYVVDYTKVYKSNIDNTINEFLFDFKQTSSIYIIRGINDFNPYTEEFLVSPQTSSGLASIALFNIKTNNLDILYTAEEGDILSQLKFSNDYSKIALIEIKANQENYLSVLENSEKKRFVKTVGSMVSGEWLDFNPMQFSPDNKYIAFSKNISGNGSGISWKSYLYVVDITTGELNNIDDGYNPSWNPRQ